jgi:hypothetical protein
MYEKNTKINEYKNGVKIITMLNQKLSDFMFVWRVYILELHIHNFEGISRHEESPNDSSWREIGVFACFMNLYIYCHHIYILPESLYKDKCNLKAY